MRRPMTNGVPTIFHSELENLRVAPIAGRLRPRAKKPQQPGDPIDESRNRSSSQTMRPLFHAAKAYPSRTLLREP